MLIALFATFSLSYGLPPNLLSSLCWVESKHKINAVHHDDGGEDSIGICQIKYSTAKNLGYKGTAKDLFKPKNNIEYSAMYLESQILKYHSIKRGVIAYNKGNAKHLTTSKYQVKVYKEWRRECSNQAKK